jgi:DNA polymerase-3 subunit alpha
MSNNFVCYHLHSDLSNGVTNIDSVTKYNQYIDRAKELGMKALAFSEHGSVFEWYHKKCDIEAAGMRYIHAVECYITETLEEKVRDNLHCVLVAKNYEGFLELNGMVSRSFNRADNHFYYVPRISSNELLATSDNIIITSACIGGILYKGNENLQEQFLRFCQKNRDRCFLEIGHHLDPQQYEHNKRLYELSKKYNLRLIAGTDTHCLNDTHSKGRVKLQESKNIHFDGEDNWDLTFKSYDELVECYRKQRSVPEEVFLQAIENTNVMADMVEEFTLDTSTKYPLIYDNPEETFKEKIWNAIESHPYLPKRYSREELEAVVNEEFEVYKKTESIDFMLLETYMREWEKAQGIECGYGRGSVSGSEIAYALGVTQMDSKKFGLNFFRFMNPSRVTNADIDTDYASADRDRVKEFLLKDRMGLPQIKTSEIITFNTIATKGAVRDIARAMNMPLSEVGEICNQIENDEIPPKLRKQYPELFEYVDIVTGTVVSIGTHPSGVLVSDLDIENLIGMCTTGTSDYQISMLNMKELDALMYVKLDILGLDNIGVINETCKLAGIERLTPDNTDLDDMEVWKEIRDDTTLIFQWESNSAQAYIRKFMSDATLDKVRDKIPNFSMLKWLSFGNGLLRPACASYRNEVADGEFYDNGFDELNEFLAPEMGRVCMQETIMQFLVKFCGYSQAESDNVRRAIAKKKGTETLLPEIESRFIEYSSTHYDITAERCAEVIKPFLQIILDASAYGFSWNHSDSYSAIGYICGYLRKYYPYEFITSALNIFKDNEEKTSAITEYAGEKGIRISPPRFGLSKDVYVFDKEKKVISKGIESVKYMNKAISNELFALKDNNYTHFMDLLLDIENKTSVNSRQLDLLIKIDYFMQFGNCVEILRIAEMFNFFKNGTAKSIKKDKIKSEVLENIISEHATDKKKDGSESKSYTITDMHGLLIACEDYIKSLNLKDLNYKLKCANQQEILGYIDLTTNNEEDRRKLMITKVVPLISKDSGEPWAYALFTKSVGSGKTSRLTLKANLYNNKPVRAMDIVYAKRVEQNKSGYWYLWDYEYVIE